MAITKWDPFREFRPLLRRSFFWPTDLLEEEWTTSLPVDVYEEKGNVVVKADLPGYKPEEVEISVTEDAVTIQAERSEEKEEKEEKRSYLRRERFMSRCARTISLPAPVEAEKADATFEEGTLTLTLPKIEKEKPEEVKVRIKTSKE